MAPGLAAISLTCEPEVCFELLVLFRIVVCNAPQDGQENLPALIVEDIGAGQLFYFEGAWLECRASNAVLMELDLSVLLPRVRLPSISLYVAPPPYGISFSSSALLRNAERPRSHCAVAANPAWNVSKQTSTNAPFILASSFKAATIASGVSSRPSNTRSQAFKTFQSTLWM